MIGYDERFTTVERLLILALLQDRSDSQRDEINSIYREQGDEVIRRAALINKVEPMVAHGLIDSISPRVLPAHWADAHRSSEDKLGAFIGALDNLAALCDSRSIRIVAIENGGIARGVQKCRGCFASNDIEILVNKGDLQEFDALLIGEGYERRSRERCASENSAQWDRDIRGWDNYRRVLPGGHEFWLNVQWRPVLRRWVPMELHLDTHDLIQRSIQISDAASRVRILSPEDNLLVCALHVASHSYVRGIGLRLQLDVDRLVRNVVVDWKKFVALACTHEAEALVFPSLAIPASIFGSPIPEEVLCGLVPSENKRIKILKLIAQAGIMYRNDHKFSALEMVRLELALSKGNLLTGFQRVLFPPAEWIRQGYSARKHRTISACYLDRLLELARRRQA